MNATNWRVDVLGGDQVRLVLWNEHWTQEFSPSDDALNDVIEALTKAREVVANGDAWYGAAS